MWFPPELPELQVLERALGNSKLAVQLLRRGGHERAYQDGDYSQGLQQIVDHLFQLLALELPGLLLVYVLVHGADEIEDGVYRVVELYVLHMPGDFREIQILVKLIRAMESFASLRERKNAAREVSQVGHELAVYPLGQGLLREVTVIPERDLPH